METHKSEQFSQTFQRLTHSASGDRFYVLDENRIHVYVVGWSGGSRFTAKVKSIALRSTMLFPHKINFFDVDPVDSHLALVTASAADRIQFYDSQNLEVSHSESSVQLDSPVYSAETFSPIVDFYWAKDEVLGEFPDANFVVVQTRDSILLFGQTPSGQMRKCFSLSGSFPDTFCCKFTFFAENRAQGKRLHGILSHLQGATFTQFMISNLESTRQTVVSKSTNFALDFGGFKRILAFDVYSMDHISVLLSDPEIAIAKYIISLNGAGNSAVHAKETMLIGRHVACQFYVYNERAPFVFGKVDEALEEFEAFKQVTAEQLGFKSLRFEVGQLEKDCYWSLVNESQFIVVSPARRRIRNFFIDKETTAVLRNEVSVVFPEPPESLRKNAIRFLKVSQRKVAFAIETQTVVSVFEVTFAMRQVDSVALIWVVDKQREFGTDTPIFFQINLLKTPQRVYRLYTLVASRKLVSLDFSLEAGAITGRAEAQLSDDVHDIFKSKQFPYNLVAFTKSETLVVLDSQLQVQTTFDMAKLRPLLPDRHREKPILGNFNLKHLYDRFYMVG